MKCIDFIQENRLIRELAPFQASSLDWHLASGTPTTPVVKRVLRLDVPVDKFPSVRSSNLLFPSLGVDFSLSFKGGKKKNLPE